MYGGNASSSGLQGYQRAATNDINVDDFVDLDMFLDNYLVQLQSDHQSQNLNMAPMMPTQQGVARPASNKVVSTGLGPMPQMPAFGQQNFLGAFGGGALGLGNAPGHQMPGSLGVHNLYNLQPQQSPFQAPQAPMPTPITTLTAAAAPGSTPTAATAKTTGAKTTRKGKAAGGRQPRKSEPDPSSSDLESSDSASSDGDHKSRKKQLTIDEAERRHLALQEKNRRAQRRFRERQKTKLLDLHKQIEELTGKVSSLQSENAALHSRTSILEKVLDMRNEQIQVMQETKETSGYPGSEEDMSSLSNVGGHLVQLTPDMIKELGSDQIYKIYQMYVKELSLRLVDSSRGDTLQDAGQSLELEGLVKDLSMMIMRLGVIKPLETRKFIVVSRQYLGNTEAEVIELWKNVMKAIDLNEQQKREVVELKRMFLQKIEPIMEERKHLNVQIQSNLPHDTFHTKNALTYIKAHEAVIKLRDNLRAEQHVVLEFAIAVFRGVFRPKQMAMLLVKCYPAVPDALGIASALAADLGEPDSPQARQLALQLGGYLESHGTMGTNYLTMHPTLMPAPSNAAASTSNGTLPRVSTSGTELFGHWMVRPGLPSIPGPEQLLSIAGGEGISGRPAAAASPGAASQFLGMGSLTSAGGLPPSMMAPDIAATGRMSESTSGAAAAAGGGTTSSASG